MEFIAKKCFVRISILNRNIYSFTDWANVLLKHLEGQTQGQLYESDFVAYLSCAMNYTKYYMYFLSSHNPMTQALLLLLYPFHRWDNWQWGYMTSQDYKVTNKRNWESIAGSLTPEFILVYYATIRDWEGYGWIEKM